MKLSETGRAPSVDRMTADDRVQWLMKVPLLADLKDNRQALESLASNMERREYPPGVPIVQEGLVGSEAFFLISGRVRVQKAIADGEMFPVALLQAADHPCFGEAALIDSDRRSATIQTDTECTCLVLDKGHFDRFSADNPAWALPVVLRIGRLVLQRLQKSNADVVLLYKALVHEIQGEGSTRSAA